MSGATYCGCDPDYVGLSGKRGYLCERHRAQGALGPTIAFGPTISIPNTPIPLPETPTAPSRMSVIPTSARDRKQYPIATGVIDYFPDALAVIAHVSWKGNEQHNPGEPLHWARGKSMDQEDCLIRHFLQRGTLDSDGIRHSAKMAWRALAMLQLELEAEQGVKS